MDKQNIASANIVSLLGIEALPMEEQRAVVDAVGALLFQAVVSRVMEQLPSADRQALGELFGAEATTGDEVLAFLAPRVPNLDAIVAEEAGKLKGDAADFVAGLGE